MAENSSSSDGINPPPEAAAAAAAAPYPLPRVTIRFCTQCKWMLRAAYFAQELLSTFSTSLGEVALQPSTGGTFVVELSSLLLQDQTTIATESPSSTSAPAPPARVQRCVLWDRKVDGGFPETKELKRRVRDAIEPGRNLGHVDRDYGRGGGGGGGHEKQQAAVASAPAAAAPDTATTLEAQPPTTAATTGKQPDGEVCEDCR